MDVFDSSPKKICLITPGHISTNPRLVKEAIALSSLGMQVHIIFTQYVASQIPFDENILNSHPNWTYDKLDWTGITISSRINRLLGTLLSLLSLSLALKVNRNLFWQVKKAVTSKADLYIAHNLGALPVAAYAAKKNRAKCGFDAEDFHRNETTDELNNEKRKLTIAIENMFIPKVAYLTASSPLISERYTSLYSAEVTTVLNVFPKIRYASKNERAGDVLQLFWFSQTIGPGRGLETIIEAINISKTAVNLHLLGQISHSYAEILISNADLEYCNIEFHKTVSSDDVFRLASKFDVGFAAEPKVPANRDICLTNKLFTYLQSGLAVFASNTSAQKKFFEAHSGIGELYSDEHQLAEFISKYHNNREKLANAKKRSLAFSIDELNWEIESQKFINVIQKNLSA
ncbi:hypothetical protein INP83_10630 [Mucilaginibacter sp. 21P]|uniref:glycosyltransferase family protein n=1 Tax=Mucilaginibacter sp. 21P TaxID=2778902 RepID=UPI001C5A32D5|nr:hypothetical protein [Mucilaginibacter sp. 21P]QXV67511.1 hypothetical protein INP83_10630 [Mucilaginibacter sp. 21P]